MSLYFSALMDTQPTEAVEILANRYGKARIRLMHVTRNGARHEVRELTVRVLCEGEFESSYSDADNSQVLPTDTMKNTVYVLAKKHGIGAIERFGRILGEHFLTNSQAASKVEVEIEEQPWSRIEVGGKPHGSAFLSAGAEHRTARVVTTRASCTVEAGLANLLVLKSSASSFEGFLQDEYTTLKNTSDRIMATSMKATWRYDASELAYDVVWAGVRRSILETFAEHVSKSVQHTLYDIGKVTLETFPQIAEIHIVMPNKHCLPVDFQRFGMSNDNDIFVPTDEPHGYIEARLGRTN